MNRFTRTRLLIGRKHFEQLQTGHVTIVGIGAVGGYVVEALARAGIEHLSLVDFDKISTSNINRHILALNETIGESKVKVAARRVLSINSKCTVETREIFCRDATLESIISPAPDLLIDAIDSLHPKCSLLLAAKERGIPVLSSMGAALRTDPSAIQSGDLFDSHGCPLARHLRQRLRRRGITKGIPCVYSSEKVDFNFKTTKTESFADQGRSRHILGSLPTIPAIFGLILANMAILHLAGKSKSKT